MQGTSGEAGYGGETLPFTGSRMDVLPMLGLAMLVVGFVVMRVAAR